MTDSRIRKWRRWADGKIETEILSMHLRREAFRQVREIVNGRSGMPPSYYFEFMEDTYATTQAVAVRRQAEPDARVCTLGQLMREIEEDPGGITRMFWLGMWDADDEEYATRMWDELFGGDVGEHIDPALVARDRALLDAQSAKVKKYVDKHLAHADAKPKADLPTYDELHAAIDALGEQFERYVLLLRATSYHTLVPVLSPAWLAVFRIPWLVGEPAPHER